MISLNLFCKIDDHLRQSHPEDQNQVCNDYIVLFFGDFKQLQLVYDLLLFAQLHVTNRYAVQGIMIYNQIKKKKCFPATKWLRSTCY